MKDKYDNVTYDIFEKSQDVLAWLEANAETITKQHDGNFRLSYIDGNYFKFAETKTIEGCVRLAMEEP